MFQAFCGPCQSGKCGGSTPTLADGLFLAIAGPEDGGIKASPVPSDPEKPGTPGEGMLSSDLDRIPTEGEAGTHTRHVKRSSPLPEGLIYIAPLVGSHGHLPWYPLSPSLPQQHLSLISHRTT